MIHPFSEQMVTSSFLSLQITTRNNTTKQFSFFCRSVCVCAWVCVHEGSVWWPVYGFNGLMLEKMFRKVSAQWQPDTSSLVWSRTHTNYTFPTVFLNMSHTAAGVNSRLWRKGDRGILTSTGGFGLKQRGLKLPVYSAYVSPSVPG